MRNIDRPGHDAVFRVPCADSVAFVALHRSIQGRSFGGIRIRAYPDEAAALTDALTLSEAMSRKVALAGIQGGGGKSVLVAPPSRRAEAMAALAAFIESLEGRYLCGPDLGFTDEDDRVLRDGTQYVACGHLSLMTARGVRTAMRAVSEPRRVLVQGLGTVGLPLAQALREDGVDVVACDVRPVDGFDVIPPEDLFDVSCDVFAPCAVGGVLTGESIARLDAQVVCGGANNQLADADTGAEELRERGILYVPDFVANVGATIEGASKTIGEGHRVEERMAAIGPLVREIISRAEETDRTPHAVAVELADARIAEMLRG